MTTTQITASRTEGCSYDPIAHWSLGWSDGTGQNFIMTRCATDELAHLWVALASLGLRDQLWGLASADWPQAWKDEEEAERQRDIRKGYYDDYEEEPTSGEGWALIPA